MSFDIGKEFDKRFKCTITFEEKKPQLKIVPFPSDWMRDKFPKWTAENARASAMFRYCVRLLWDDTESACREREQERGRIQRKYGAEALAWILKAQEWAKGAKRLIKEAEQAKEILPELQAKIDFAGGPLPEFIKKERENRRSYVQKMEVLKAYGEPRIKGVEVGALAHKNEIQYLASSNEWELYIDESGKDEEFATGKDGIIAGVLSDVKHHLPEQPSLHAATDDTEEKIAAGDKLLDTLIHHEQAGVLAVPMYALASVSGWGHAVASFIDLVMRLLPLSEKGVTKLTVFIEERAPYLHEKNFTFLRDACCFALAQTFPDCANSIHLEIKKMDKNSPFDAYADLVANTCFAKNDFSQERLRLTGWKRTCFLNFQSDELAQVLDIFHSGRKLPMNLWNKLLVGKSAAGKQSLVNALLARFGEEARGEIIGWEEYLAEVMRHLDSKAIDLHLLERQIEWLRTYRPDDYKVPRKVEFGWVTASLALQNHRGAVMSEDEFAKFKQLGDELYEEAAPLVCWAFLNVVVALTNAFRFEDANKLVDEFMARIHEVAVVGTRYYGQLLSTKGQCLAFLGKDDEAWHFFDLALKKFDALSAVYEKRGEMMQTQAYWLTAMMDDSSTSDAELTAAAKLYFTENADASEGELVTAAKKLAKSTDPKRKYQHHLLLRYIVSGRAPQSVRSAYLAEEGEWGVEYGHPWELIEFYRGLICETPEDRARHFEVAYGKANAGDATLQMIACAILGARLAEGMIAQDVYEEKLAHVHSLFPHMDAVREAVLRQQVETPLPAADFMVAVLPFNFR